MESADDQSDQSDERLMMEQLICIFSPDFGIGVGLCPTPLSEDRGRKMVAGGWPVAGLWLVSR